MIEKTYCEFVNGLGDSSDNPNKIYHDTEYGFPILDDRELFARLVLEINQAGLSWSLILHKRENFYQAYDGFDIAIVGGYKDSDIKRLMSDPGIVRNRLKIEAAIYNAQQFLVIQKECGSFYNWLSVQEARNKAAWVALFKKHFKFVGGEIVNEFLMSIGYLSSAHDVNCPIFAKVLLTKPRWLE